jgi:hypothetical protein
MRKLILMVGIIVIVVACSDTVGGVLEDAGTMLQDAGEQMQDAGAQAQESKSITCNQSYTRTPPGGEPSTTKYELVDTVGNGFPDVTMKAVYGSQDAPWLDCPEGWTCQNMPTGKVTWEIHPTVFIDGKVFIQTCPGSGPREPESVTIFY